MASMNKKLTWFGHNCFMFEYADVKFILDPFVVDGLSPVTGDKLSADYLLVSHGHGDHCANVFEIAKNSNATIIGIAEVAGYFSQKGLKTEPVNIGGSVYLPFSQTLNDTFCQALAVQAPHSSTMPDGTSGGNSLGFILAFPKPGKSLLPSTSSLKPLSQKLAEDSAFKIYFACDTGYFSEMAWIGTLGIDVAVLPIGDRYTMGPSLSLDAIATINPRYVVPSHYNTWEPIAQDANEWRQAVSQYAKSTKPLVLKPGDTVSEHADLSWG